MIQTSFFFNVRHHLKLQHDHKFWNRPAYTFHLALFGATDHLKPNYVIQQMEELIENW